MSVTLNSVAVEPPTVIQPDPTCRCTLTGTPTGAPGAYTVIVDGMGSSARTAGATSNAETSSTKGMLRQNRVIAGDFNRTQISIWVRSVPALAHERSGGYQ